MPVWYSRRWWVTNPSTNRARRGLTLLTWLTQLLLRRNSYHDAQLQSAPAHAATHQQCQKRAKHSRVYDCQSVAHVAVRSCMRCPRQLPARVHPGRSVDSRLKFDSGRIGCCCCMHGETASERSERQQHTINNETAANTRQHSSALCCATSNTAGSQSTVNAAAAGCTHWRVAILGETAPIRLLLEWLARSVNAQIPLGPSRHDTHDIHTHTHIICICMYVCIYTCSLLTTRQNTNCRKRADTRCEQNFVKKLESVSVKLHLRDGRTVRPSVLSFVSVRSCVCQGRPSYRGIELRCSIEL